MLPAASLRSLRLRGKDSWLWVFMEKSNYRDRLNITVAYASGSEGSVLIPWLFFCLLFFPCLCFCLFREIPWLCLMLLLLLHILISVFFRVNPWQMLLLLLIFPSVAMLNASACSYFRVFPCHSVAMLLLILPSVFFRVNPWLILLFLLLSFPCPSVAMLNASAYSSFRG